MYTPKHFKISDRKEIFDLINNNSFGILVSINDGKLNATHLPFLLKSEEGENGIHYAHAAKANYQMNNIDEEVLVIFPGAHKYISPTWYEPNKAVPTWSYIAVHVYGIIKIVSDRESKIEIVKNAVNYFEEDQSSYKIKDLEENYFENLIVGITAFKIEITGLEGKKKISQNHSEDRQKKVLDKLENYSDENSLIIAESMKYNLNKNKM